MSLLLGDKDRGEVPASLTRVDDSEGTVTDDCVLGMPGLLDSSGRVRLLRALRERMMSSGLTKRGDVRRETLGLEAVVVTRVVEGGRLW
jgi:hypothetical protein